jgi:hypothetical protein
VHRLQVPVLARVQGLAVTREESAASRGFELA